LNRLILHVGASKCGSSALQTFLSSHPLLYSDVGENLEYGAITNKGIIYQRELTLSAAQNISGYISSASAKYIAAKSQNWRNNIIQSINFRIKQGTSVVLSNEGWFHRWRDLNNIDFFQRVEANIDVICYVRPQVPFMNSAWWQWGAWSDMPFEDWIKQRLPATQWGNIAEHWRKLDWIDSITIKPLSSDIIANFLDFINITESSIESNRSNAGLPAEILRLFQKYRTLRPHPQKGQIDFALSRHLGHISSPPWVIDMETSHNIIQQTRESNNRLLLLMDPAEEKNIRKNMEWWSSAAFQNKIVESPSVQILDTDQLERLCAEMAKIIFNLEKNIISLPRV
jgi:hypothetical protein